MRKTQLQAVYVIIGLSLALCLISHVSRTNKTNSCKNTYTDKTVVNIDTEDTLHTSLSVNTNFPSFVGLSISELNAETTEHRDVVNMDVFAEPNTAVSEEYTTTDIDILSTAKEDATDNSIESETAHEETTSEVIVTGTNKWGISLTDDEIDLLARIVWVESRGECTDGQKAVAEVVFYRMCSDEFPDTLYGVLSQSGQFASWPIRNTATDYGRQVKIVKEVLAGKTNVLPRKALYFATSPLGRDIVSVIDNHYFTSDYNK